MKIILQPHLKLRLKQRQIPQNYPEKVLSQPEEKYFDTFTNHLIVIRKLKYNKRIRPMTVAYDIIEEDIQIITIYPTTKQEIKNKLKRGRWLKNEKN